MDESSSVTAESDVPRGERARSSSVLNTLYHETRQEIELLGKQILVKDNNIAHLKAKLSRYERLYVADGEGEPVGFGPSNSLVESLFNQLSKEKQRKNDLEFKASRLEEEIQRLRMQVREKELELESMRLQPDHEKDQEIHRLRTALEEKERVEATRAVLCTSLAEEADQLRGQLSTTVTVCQQLLARLENEKKGGGGGQVEEICQQQKVNEKSESSAVKAQIHQLQEENQQLKQRVAYVQGLNCQWQKYDSSREDFIQGLCQRLKETTGQGFLPMKGTVNTGLLHKEISRLNRLLEEKIRECERLDREVEDVRRQSKERIQTLEQQALIYTDDFKSERADRENAQSQIQDLKEQISQLKQQLRKQGACRQSRDVGSVCRVHTEHRMFQKRNKDALEPLLRTAPERQQQQPAVAAAAALANWNKPSDQSEIQCLHCPARFNDPDEYTNHSEECGHL